MGNFLAGIMSVLGQQNAQGGGGTTTVAESTPGALPASQFAVFNKLFGGDASTMDSRKEARNAAAYYEAATGQLINGDALKGMRKMNKHQDWFNDDGSLRDGLSARKVKKATKWARDVAGFYGGLQKNTRMNADGSTVTEDLAGYKDANFANQEELNAGRKWAMQNYLNEGLAKSQLEGLENGLFADNQAALDWMAANGGFAKDSAEYKKAASGNAAWGDGMNAMYQQTINSLLQNGKMDQAYGLMNAIGKGNMKMASGKQVADMSGAFTDEAKKNFMTGNNGANMAGFNKFYAANGDDAEGWEDNYLAFKKQQDALAKAQQDYSSYFKKGGTMKKQYFKSGGAVNKFQDGGAMQQITKAVQMAIEEIKSGKPGQGCQMVAQIPDETVAQIAQAAPEIGKVITQIKQALAPKSKNGSKLSYIHELRTGCPAGSEPYYYKEGGHMCKKCLFGEELEAMKCGGKAKKKKCEDGAVITEKCGGKSKKAACGEKLACGGKKKKNYFGGTL